MKQLFTILTVLILASCKKNDSKDYALTGTWKWISTCGGITGGCTYANAGSTRSIEFMASRIIESYGDGSVTDKAYTLVSKTMYGDYALYEIRFDNGATSRIKVYGATADMERGDMRIGYKR